VAGLKIFKRGGGAGGGGGGGGGGGATPRRAACQVRGRRRLSRDTHLSGRGRATTDGDWKSARSLHLTNKKAKSEEKS